MDAFPGISPSMETIAAGMAGFALARLFSFAQKPQIMRKESPRTYDTPPSHFSGMGHDFHILARLIAEKERHLQFAPRATGAEEIMHQMLRSFQPQLAEFSSFEWRGSPTGQGFPNVSEMIGRSTHITYTAESQLQLQRQPAKPSKMTPAWSQSEENYFEPVTRDHEVKHTRSIEGTPEDYAGRQTDQRTRKCTRRGDDGRRRGWGWCRRGGDDEAKHAGRDWAEPRDNDDDRWGWSRYR